MKQSDNDSRQSSNPCVDSIVVPDEKISGFIDLIENWGCNEFQIVSDILCKDKEYVKKQMQIDYFKHLIIETVICNLEEREKQVLVKYIKLQEEKCDEIIDETLSAVESERTTRVIDNEAAGSMERRKREGYF